MSKTEATFKISPTLGDVKKFLQEAEAFSKELEGKYNVLDKKGKHLSALLDTLEKDGKKESEHYKAVRANLDDVIKRQNELKIAREKAFETSKNQKDYVKSLVTQKQHLIEEIATYKTLGLTGTDTYNKLTAEIKAINQGQETYNKALQDTQKEFGQLGTVATKSFTDSLASLGLALNAIDQIGGKLLDLRNASVSFNQSLATIGTLGAKNFRDLRDDILDLSSRMPFAAEQIYTK